MQNKLLKNSCHFIRWKAIWKWN